ncbi:MAG: tyrosine-type recombinase/integrase [Gemmatimonadales bacterium]|nr:tyrosine-type recombinase/integrase [Gemmatimonadales bacterium]
METHSRDPVRSLLAHYHARLLAHPTLVRQLDVLGLATADTLATHRLGFADRTAARTLLRGPARERTWYRDAWRAAGFLVPAGSERFRGCIVLPLQGTTRAVGLRVCELGAPGSRALWSDADGSRVFAPSSPARPEFASSLVVTVDPFDALLLRGLGTGHVLSLDAMSIAGAEDAVLERLRSTGARRLLVVIPGTTAGRALTEQLAGLTIARARLQGRFLSVVLLPAGCHLRDVWRLHGAAAAAAVLRGASWRPPLTVSTRDHTTAPRRHRLPWHDAVGTLATAFGAYVAHLEAGGAPRDLVKRRVRALDALRRSCAECTECTAHAVVDIAALSVACVEAFQTSQLAQVDRAGLPSRNGVIRTLCDVRHFLRWAHRAGCLPQDVTSALPPLRRTAAAPPPVLTAPEVERILDTTPVRTPGGLRDRAMLEVLYSSGIRRVELVGLDVTDLDEVRGTLTIRRGKGGTARVVPLGRRARGWVARYVERVRVAHLRTVGDPALFLSRRGRRVTAKLVTGRMRACLRAAGIEKAGSCHIFRHSAATLMHDRGADIRDLQALLGHALLTSTQLYTRVSMQRLLAVHARTHPAESQAAAYGSADITPRTH